MKLVSRAAWGARAYRQPSGGITYSRARRGVKLHYLGTPYSDRAHDQCAAYVRRIQASHMDGNGWSDIGYSFVVCTHGTVYEGRGLRRRNSANGNTTLNEQDYAVLLLVGSSGLTEPTTAQLHGARDAIDYCREEGPAGTWLGGHRDGYATSCPGDAVYAWAKAGAPRPDDEEDDMPLTDDDIRLLATKDGIFKAPQDAADWDPNPNSPGHYWALGTHIYGTTSKVRAIEKRVASMDRKLDALETTGMTEAQIEAVAAEVSRLLVPAVLDALAGRLQS